MAENGRSARKLGSRSPTLTAKKQDAAGIDSMKYVAGVGPMPMWPTRGTHAKPEAVPHAMSAAQRRAKWRRDHKDLHAAQQRAYRKRRAAKQRQAGRSDSKNGHHN